MLVLLGEVGGADEYDVCDALKSGRITKPVVAWCIGTCASIFPFEVRFQRICARRLRHTFTHRCGKLLHYPSEGPTDTTLPLTNHRFNVCLANSPLNNYQVQFGHAGACARGQGETAADKNAALAAAGAVVPVSFDEFPSKIKEVFDG